MEHRRLFLADAWEHRPPTEVTCFAIAADQSRPPEVHGRASVEMSVAGFSLSLRPTPAELRALAALFLATAEDQEVANVPPYTGPRAAWPAGLTHLPEAQKVAA